MSKELHSLDIGGKRFKYQSTPKQVEGINSRTLYVAVKETERSFYMDEMEERVQLDLSRSFRDFNRDTYRWSTSLVELLYHKNEVIDGLIKLVGEGGDGVVSGCRLMGALVTDLDEEVQHRKLDLIEALSNCVDHKVEATIIRELFQMIGIITKKLMQPDDHIALLEYILI